MSQDDGCHGPYLRLIDRLHAFGGRHQTILERSWVGVALAYGMVRILLADRFLAEYGLSTKVFALIELSSSLLYGFALLHVVRNFAIEEHGRTIRWGMLGLVGFASPDIYVFAKIRKVPTSLVVILVVIVVLSLVASIVAVRKKLASAQLPP